jgi:hypothetical protein
MCLRSRDSAGMPWMAMTPTFHHPLRSDACDYGLSCIIHCKVL